MKASDLQSNEFASYYKNYIDQTNNLSLLECLRSSNKALNSLFNSISEQKMGYKYGEDKWSISEMLLHIIDAERVFAYRALRFARKDNTDLPGFEHNDYVVHSEAKNRSKQSLLNEYNAQRASTISLFEGFSDDMLKKIGTANGNPMSVRALGLVISGHEIHHCNILKERYL